MNPTSKAKVRAEEVSNRVQFRVPTPGDGHLMWTLAGACPPVEQNTCYAYLLLCTHFSETCVFAECGGASAGYVAAYVLPGSPSVLFVWQIGVHESLRGAGVGKKMLAELLLRPACARVEFLETTVSSGNCASQRMFRGLARDLDCSCTEHEFFRSSDFGNSSHEEENLIRIGPIRRSTR